MIQQNNKEETTRARDVQLQAVRLKAEQHLRVIENALSARQPDRLEAGQVWLTKKDCYTPSGTHHVPRGWFVLILDAPRRVRGSDETVVDVAMIHPEVFNATDSDLLLPEDIPVVGGGMVSMWNRGSILVRNLDRFAVHLEAGLLKQCEMLLRHVAGKKVQGLPEIPIGPAIVSTLDLRHDFQQQLLRETSILWQSGLPALRRADSTSRTTYVRQAARDFLDDVRRAIRSSRGDTTTPALETSLAFQTGAVTKADRHPLSPKISRRFTLPELPDIGGELLFEKGVLQIILKGNVTAASLGLRHSMDRHAGGRSVPVASYPGENGRRERDRTVLTIPSEDLGRVLRGNAILRITSSGRTATTSLRQMP